MPRLRGRSPQAQQAIPVQREGVMAATLKRIRTKTLEIAYEDSGPESGVPVLLMHGFPYDPRAYDDVVAQLRTAYTITYASNAEPTQRRVKVRANRDGSAVRLSPVVGVATP